MTEKTKGNKNILNRLRRVEGQVRGIQQMIEADRKTTDILIQITAARSALKNVGIALVEGEADKDDVSAEMRELIRKIANGL
ncbi:hypothetical protein MFLO_05345 [Listeria floridensis FSL S10-1187]|uniref:Uncharacterized protein n=1 Tax=Listeria floridensis FSL S10-1187 TaxID=1265817 RepID=A0ABN0RGM9_9LIST|nr:metal-sensitive transcriptional regulator [Listeria floridensis]EUJ33012.1 hypothetical protein MFLO_05345 [Listeria floridensis FSL S10-1187]